MKYKSVSYLLTLSFLLLISCFSTKNDSSKHLKIENEIKKPLIESVISKPDSSRYTPITLAQGLDEPLGMDILPNNNVLFIERKGDVKLYIASIKQMKTIAHFNVFSGIEDGLLGVALDPDFEKNNWVYFYYALAGSKSVSRLSRFELQGENLLMKSEKVLLEIPTQRQYCCHSAGSLTFGPDKLLYVSIGDNTNAEESEGYVPIDERPGRELSDDQATAANTNDLRGKILRIKPEDNGTYSIPEGNLFPKGMPNTRPEIYVMGCRNPYRVSIDMKTGFIYWGDVGPATTVPGEEGTLSYDEINQAKKPGFFGWPYFLGNNEAFPHYDFATKKEGPKFDPLKPVNNSRNNTGIKELPPAQPAFIWYGRLPSKRFPLVGKGGATAMAGPIFYSDLYPQSKVKLSDYYNGKLFIYDWVRRWIMAVTLDEQGNYLSMEPFLSHLKHAAPMDMKIGPDGALYILEYGTNWFSKNVDARLVRIEYSEGNRKPIANIKTDKLYGAAPFYVKFSASESIDYDKGDTLSYEWQIEGKKYQNVEQEYTFSKPGIYDIILNVTDDKGATGSSSLQVNVGNSPPEVDISTSSNRTFYWDNSILNYKVNIKDKEDQVIDPSRIKISFTYIEHGKDLASGFMDDSENVKFIRGGQLVANLDCRACHSKEEISVGPSYRQIAKRYEGKPEAQDALMKKIVKGGSGTWGTREMPPHPDMPEEDVKEIVNYILSVNDQKPNLPLAGNIKLTDHINKGIDGSYLFTASYKDNGANNIEPIITRKHFTLRNPLLQIEDYDFGNLRIATLTTAFISYARTRNNGFVKYNQLDLTDVKQIKYRIQSHGIGGNIEVRLDSVKGKLVSVITVPAGEVKDLKTNWKDVYAPISPTKGIHDLYIVFINPADRYKNLLNIDWLQFLK